MDQGRQENQEGEEEAGPRRVRPVAAAVLSNSPGPMAVRQGIQVALAAAAVPSCPFPSSVCFEEAAVEEP